MSCSRRSARVTRGTTPCTPEGAPLRAPGGSAETAGRPPPGCLDPPGRLHVVGGPARSADASDHGNGTATRTSSARPSTAVSTSAGTALVVRRRSSGAGFQSNASVSAGDALAHVPVRPRGGRDRVAVRARFTANSRVSYPGSSGAEVWRAPAPVAGCRRSRRRRSRVANDRAMSVIPRPDRSSSRRCPEPRMPSGTGLSASRLPTMTRSTWSRTRSADAAHCATVTSVPTGRGHSSSWRRTRSARAPAERAGRAGRPGRRCADRSGSVGGHRSAPSTSRAACGFARVSMPRGSGPSRPRPGDPTH